MRNIDKQIEENLTIKLNYVDLFYAFCNAKGIDDPECDVSTDEEYEALEKEFESKITLRDLQSLNQLIIKDAMNHVSEQMRDVERREV